MASHYSNGIASRTRRSRADLLASPQFLSQGIQKMDTSSSTANETPKVSGVNSICILGGAISSDDPIIPKLKSLGLQVNFVRNVDDVPEGVLNSEESSMAFVILDFEGKDFERLQKKEASILGPPAVREMAKRGHGPVTSTRPLYCTIMEGLGVCFNSHRKRNKAEIHRYFFLIHSMGGSILKDTNSSRVTHLVADHCRGEKYRYCSTFGIPVMTGAWLESCWERRNELDFKASDKGFCSAYKVKPFHGACICLLGFAEDEHLHMKEELERNGGRETLDANDGQCTHIVVDDSTITSLPNDIPKDVPVVKSEWFWASIQMDACAEERLHVFSDHLGSILSPYNPNTPCNRTAPNNRSLFSPGGTPGSSSSNHSRKRKRRREAVSQLAQLDPAPGLNVGNTTAFNKRRSSVGELAHLYDSGSFLLDTPDRNLLAANEQKIQSGRSSSNILQTNDGETPPKTGISVTSPTPPQKQAPNSSSTPKKPEGKPMTARQHIFQELVQTENNYITILRTILEEFMKPLEGYMQEQSSQFLNQTEINLIFGDLPPIYEVHVKMYNEFMAALNNWTEDFSVGDVYLRYADDLMKAYPPFVNFFEKAKQTILECDKAKPRFHAFLKQCQCKPECGRQTLAELMIRPVQRLPSVILLLNDLLKHTKKEREHKDTPKLEEALAKIKQVLTNINEDKRKTEGQVCIFEIFSDIENCPPSLVSSHRSFVGRIDAIELGGSDELCGKGYVLSFFLFSDVLEITKKRSSSTKGLGLRSPSTMSLRSMGMAQGGTLGSYNGNPNMNETMSRQDLTAAGGSRSLKHVNMMSLSSVKRVVDIVEVDGQSIINIFGLVCRTNQELKERMFVLQIVNEMEGEKITFLKSLCRNIANINCRPDPNNFLVQKKAEDLGLDPSDLNVSNFGSRAYRTLHKKVNRAFSFNKTPTGSRLKRAMSSMISPIAPRGPYHHQHMTSVSGSTPSGDLQNLRLASCASLYNSSNMPIQQNVGQSEIPSTTSASTTNLLAPSESPKSSRGIMSRMRHHQSTSMMPPPSMPLTSYIGNGTPKRGMTSMVASSPNGDHIGNSDEVLHKNKQSSDSGENGFTLPKTPTLVNKCSRRPSFKFKSSAFIGSKK